MTTTKEFKHGKPHPDGKGWVCACETRLDYKVNQSCSECSLWNPQLRQDEIQEIVDLDSDWMDNPPPKPTVQEKTPKQKAQYLTRRIKTSLDTWLATGDELGKLVVEARDTEAWKTMEYRSWTAYVEAEFPQSRQHIYKVIDRFQVVMALEEATGEENNSSVARATTFREAQAIKPNLDIATADLRVRIADGTDPGEAFKAIVEEYGRPDYEEIQAPVEDPVGDSGQDSRPAPEEEKPPTPDDENKPEPVADPPVGSKSKSTKGLTGNKEHTTASRVPAKPTPKSHSYPTWVSTHIEPLNGFKYIDHSTTIKLVELKCNSVEVDVEEMAKDFAAYWSEGQIRHGWADPMSTLKNPRVLNIRIARMKRQHGGSSSEVPCNKCGGSGWLKVAPGGPDDGKDEYEQEADRREREQEEHHD